MRERHSTWAPVVLLAAGLTCLFAACGNTQKNPDAAAGDAGSPSPNPHAGAGAGGNPAAAGSAAVGGTEADSQGGAGATAGAAPGPGGSDDGSAGSGANQAGAGNSGGAPASSGRAECAGDEDCVVVDDCCTCAAVPSADQPPACEKACKQSACSAAGIQAKAHCRSKRCVFDLSCDRSKVTCKIAEPKCKAGQVPSVVGSCYGPCIDVGQCRDVTDCTACAPGQACVKNGDSLPFTQCVSVAPSCAQSPTCGCTDACPFSCSDADGIGCFCITC